jgi:hypothetical protein
VARLRRQYETLVAAAVQNSSNCSDFSGNIDRQHATNNGQLDAPFHVRDGISCGLAGEPGWDRTIDLLIKSQLLYH